MSSVPAVLCRNLSKSFGSVRAVRDVSFDVAPGEFVALLGPSGCGKTTALRLIAGLERPDDGLVALNGQPVSDGRLFVAPDRRRVGLVFQDYALFPHLTVAQNVGYGLDGRAASAPRVGEMLALVGLAGLDARFPHELSGGQQQRVALARALAPRPAILLLDEPFSNLDAALRGQVRADVRQIIREAGVAAILVTHDQDEALSLSDRVGVMFEGALCQIDTPRRVYETPVSRRVGEFVGEANILPGTSYGAQADSPLGRICLAQPANGSTDLLIRPEDLTLHDSAANPDGAPAVIRRCDYFGAHQSVWVALPDGTLLKVTSRADLVWQPGQRVTVAARRAVAFAR